MPAEHPVEFKCKVIQRYKKGESIKDLYQCIDCGYQGIDLDERGDCPECGSGKIEVLSGEKAKYVTDQFAF